MLDLIVLRYSSDTFVIFFRASETASELLKERSQNNQVHTITPARAEMKSAYPCGALYPSGALESLSLGCRLVTIRWRSKPRRLCTIVHDSLAINAQEC